MQIQNIQNNNNTNFGMKNTFLNKSKKAENIVDKNYWESLHNEAIARFNRIKFQKAKKEFGNIKESDNIFSFMKAISKVTYRKVLSTIYEGRAHDKFPNRYSAPDNIATAFTEKERHYKIKN